MLFTILLLFIFPLWEANAEDAGYMVMASEINKKKIWYSCLKSDDQPLNISSNSISIQLPNLDGPFAYDQVHDQIYLTSNGALFRMNLDGNLEYLEFYSDITCMEIDDIQRRLYYYSAEEMRVYNIQTEDHDTLFTFSDVVSDLQLDRRTGYIFFASTSGVGRFHIDSPNEYDDDFILSSGSVGIGLDQTGERLYLANMDSDVVHSYNTTDVGNRELILNSSSVPELTGPVDVIAIGQYIYVRTLTHDRLIRAYINGSCPVTNEGGSITTTDNTETLSVVKLNPNISSRVCPDAPIQTPYSCPNEDTTRSLYTFHTGVDVSTLSTGFETGHTDTGVSTTLTGVGTVTYTGHTYSASSTAINDNSPPTIQCPSDISSTDQSPVWTKPTAVDEPVCCTNEPGECYEIGSITKVSCTTTDISGQEASCSFYITVETHLSREIAKLTKNVTDENVEEVAVELEELMETAGDSGELKPADIQEASNALEAIASTESPSITVTDAVVGTVDTILASDSSDLPPETTSLILESFEQQISTVAMDGQNYTENTKTLSVNTLSFYSNNLEITFFIDEVQNLTDICFGNVCPSTSHFITLPNSVIPSSDQRANVSFTSYYTSNLFQSSTGYENLSSAILSATVYADNLTGVFPEPIELVFTVSKIYSDLDALCVYWNATLNMSGDWSTNGCRLVARNNTDDGSSITCHCTHLTNFAVLFLPKESSEKVSKGVSLLLNLLTYVGCGISIVFLLLTIVTILSIRNLRKRQPQKILVNLCVSLICLYTMFIFGIDIPTPKSNVCMSIAVLLHYFLLTSIAWTSVEAANMYYLFIKIFNVDKSKFLLISYIFAWGLPSIPPIVLLSIDTSFYKNEQYCYLNTEYSNVFIYAVFIPIAIAMIFNYVMFVLVIQSLFCSRSVATKNCTLKEKKKRVVNAIAISLLLGLTWIFGFLISIVDNGQTVFGILFCVLNSFQGVAIFCMFPLNQKECRDAWKAWVVSVCKPCRRERTEMDVYRRSMNDTIVLSSIDLVQQRYQQECATAFQNNAIEESDYEQDKDKRVI